MPQLPSLPALLVSIDTGGADYTVRLSDMANVWTESLDRKAICMRGWSENTVIDPSDTPENMGTLLTSLRSALDSSHSGHAQTSISLSPGSAKDAGDDSLTLNVTCSLPGLQPLKWPLHLKKCPSSAIAVDLVLPLIQAQHARQRQVVSLIDIVGNKDGALAKLLDKLEATGTGLENVFTSLSGKKKVPRAMAEAKVKGLAVFDVKSWKTELGDEDDGPDSPSDLIQAVLGRDGLQYSSTFEIERSTVLDTWWSDFQGTSQISHPSQAQAASAIKGTPPSLDAKESDMGDDDFQVQPTPPHLLSPGKSGPAGRDRPKEGDDCGEDQDDQLAVLNKRSVVSPASSKDQTKNPRSRLGAIGSENQQLSAKSVKEDANNGQKLLNTSAEESETASEASDDEIALPNREKPRPPAVSHSTAKPGAKIGVIGKSVKTKLHSPAQETGPVAEEKASVDPGPMTKRLGVIGKNAKSERPIPGAGGDDSGTARGISETREIDAKDEPRESSQERADRKREELKRELDRKTAAGPAKKKRRF